MFLITEMKDIFASELRFEKFLPVIHSYSKPVGLTINIEKDAIIY